MVSFDCHRHHHHNYFNHKAKGEVSKIVVLIGIVWNLFPVVTYVDELLDLFSCSCLLVAVFLFFYSVFFNPKAKFN